MAKMVSRIPPMAGRFLAPLAVSVPSGVAMVASQVLEAEYRHFTAIAGFFCCR